MSRFLAAAAAASLAAACAGLPAPAGAQTPPAMPPMSSIQPETTITLNGTGSVDRAPDLAHVSVGVSIDGETAAAAMGDQAQRMTAVLSTLRGAGVAQRDIQTSNLTLNPVYDYNTDGRPRLTGYNVSNQMDVTVRDLANLGKVLDAIVKAGGNTINGVSFGLTEPTQAQNEARVAAIKDAAARAELYASAVGYRVARIVTIMENEYYSPPMPVARMAMAQAAESSTPVAGGEVQTVASVNVTFELTR
jgi:hypothetical protein